MKMYLSQESFMVLCEEKKKAREEEDYFWHKIPVILVCSQNQTRSEMFPKKHKARNINLEKVRPQE